MLCCVVLCSAQANKVALCVGVSHYLTSPLHNAAKDASDLASALTARGVQVHLLANPTAQDLTAAIDTFCSTTITQHTELAVFFFAGHGAVCPSGDTTLSGKHIMMASCWDNTPYTSFADVSNHPCSAAQTCIPFWLHCTEAAHGCMHCAVRLKKADDAMSVTSGCSAWPSQPGLLVAPQHAFSDLECC